MGSPMFWVMKILFIRCTSGGKSFEICWQRDYRLMFSTPGLMIWKFLLQVFAFAVLIHQSVVLVAGMKENKETKVFKNGDAVT